MRERCAERGQAPWRWTIATRVRRCRFRAVVGRTSHERPPPSPGHSLPPGVTRARLSTRRAPWSRSRGATQRVRRGADKARAGEGRRCRRRCAHRRGGSCRDAVRVDERGRAEERELARSSASEALSRSGRGACGTWRRRCGLFALTRRLVSDAVGSINAPAPTASRSTASASASGRTPTRSREAQCSS